MVNTWSKSMDFMGKAIEISWEFSMKLDLVGWNGMKLDLANCEFLAIQLTICFYLYITGFDWVFWDVSLKDDPKGMISPRWMYLPSSFSVAGKWSTRILEMGMGQYLLIPFLVGWTSIYQLFCCSPGVQGFDPSPDDFSRKFHLVDLPATVDYQRLMGSVSKPCTPGEHQNSW